MKLITIILLLISNAVTFRRDKYTHIYYNIYRRILFYSSVFGFDKIAMTMRLKYCEIAKKIQQTHAVLEKKRANHEIPKGKWPLVITFKAVISGIIFLVIFPYIALLGLKFEWSIKDLNALFDLAAQDTIGKYILVNFSNFCTLWSKFLEYILYEISYDISSKIILNFFIISVLIINDTLEKKKQKIGLLHRIINLLYRIINIISWLTNIKSSWINIKKNALIFLENLHQNKTRIYLFFLISLAFSILYKNIFALPYLMSCDNWDILLLLSLINTFACIIFTVSVLRKILILKEKITLVFLLHCLENIRFTYLFGLICFYIACTYYVYPVYIVPAIWSVLTSICILIPLIPIEIIGAILNSSAALNPLKITLKSIRWPVKAINFGYLNNVTRLPITKEFSIKLKNSNHNYYIKYNAFTNKKFIDFKNTNTNKIIPLTNYIKNKGIIRHSDTFSYLEDKIRRLSNNKIPNVSVSSNDLLESPKKNIRRPLHRGIITELPDSLFDDALKNVPHKTLIDMGEEEEDTEDIPMTTAPSKSMLVINDPLHVRMSPTGLKGGSSRHIPDVSVNMGINTQGSTNLSPFTSHGNPMYLIPETTTSSNYPIDLEARNKLPKISVLKECTVDSLHSYIYELQHGLTITNKKLAKLSTEVWSLHQGIKENYYEDIKRIINQKLLTSGTPQLSHSSFTRLIGENTPEREAYIEYVGSSLVRNKYIFSNTAIQQNLLKLRDTRSLTNTGITSSVPSEYSNLNVSHANPINYTGGSSIMNTSRDMSYFPTTLNPVENFAGPSTTNQATITAPLHQPSATKMLDLKRLEEISLKINHLKLKEDPVEDNYLRDTENITYSTFSAYPKDFINRCVSSSSSVETSSSKGLSFQERYVNNLARGIPGRPTVNWLRAISDIDENNVFIDVRVHNWSRNVNRLDHIIKRVSSFGTDTPVLNINSYPWRSVGMDYPDGILRGIFKIIPYKAGNTLPPEPNANEFFQYIYSCVHMVHSQLLVKAKDLDKIKIVLVTDYNNSDASIEDYEIHNPENYSQIYNLINDLGSEELKTYFNNNKNRFSWVANSIDNWGSYIYKAGNQYELLLETFTKEMKSIIDWQKNKNIFITRVCDLQIKELLPKVCITEIVLSEKKTTINPVTTSENIYFHPTYYENIPSSWPDSVLKKISTPGIYYINTQSYVERNINGEIVNATISKGYGSWNRTTYDTAITQQPFGKNIANTLKHMKINGVNRGFIQLFSQEDVVNFIIYTIINDPDINFGNNTVNWSEVSLTNRIIDIFSKLK